MPEGDSIPKPIIMKDSPVQADTLEDLASKGFTLEEIKAAAEGKRIGVLGSQGFYYLTEASYSNDNNWTIAYYQSRFDNTGNFSGTGCGIYRSSGELFVEVYEV